MSAPLSLSLRTRVHVQHIYVVPKKLVEEPKKRTGMMVPNALWDVVRVYCLDFKSLYIGVRKTIVAHDFKLK